MKIAICQCKQELIIDRGLDWESARNEAIKQGWIYGGQRWRCSDCHQKWMAKTSMKNLVKGEVA